jgi:hypothetical protein
MLNQPSPLARFARPFFEPETVRGGARFRFSFASDRTSEEASHLWAGGDVAMEAYDVLRSRVRSDGD